jgi:hypothetical protein
MAAHAAAGEIVVPVSEHPLEEIAAVWEAQAASPRVKQVVLPR